MTLSVQEVAKSPVVRVKWLTRDNFNGFIKQVATTLIKCGYAELCFDRLNYSAADFVKLSNNFIPVFSLVADIRQELDTRTLFFRAYTSNSAEELKILGDELVKLKEIGEKRNRVRCGTLVRQVRITAVDEWQATYEVQTEAVFHWNYRVYPGMWNAKIHMTTFVRKENGELAYYSDYEFNQSVENARRDAFKQAVESVARYRDKIKATKQAVESLRYHRQVNAAYAGPTLPYPEKPYD